MKTTTLLSQLSSLVGLSLSLVACACSEELPILAANNSSEELVLIKISPPKISLDLSSKEHSSSNIGLLLKKSSKKAGVFNRFYSCWKPVLTAKNGRAMELPCAGSGAFREPNVGDFPLLKPGKTAKSTCSVRVLEIDSKFLFVVNSQYGDVFQGEVEIGEYTFSIHYSSELGSKWLEEKLAELEVDSKKVVKASASSNSVTVVIGK